MTKANNFPGLAAERGTAPGEPGTVFATRRQFPAMQHLQTRGKSSLFRFPSPHPSTQGQDTKPTPWSGQQSDTMTSGAAKPAKTTTTTPSTPRSSLKRKRGSTSALKPSTATPARQASAFKADDDEPSTKATKKQKKKQEEKRSRIFRKKAPLSFLEKLERAQSQRLVPSKQHAHPSLNLSG